MKRIPLGCATWLRRVTSIVALTIGGLVGLGCRSEMFPLGPELDVRPPETWHSVDPKSLMVPGKPIAAWRGPKEASLVAYRTLPIPGGTAESIAAELENRLTNLPGLEVKVRKVVEVDGRSAAWVEVVAPGSGKAIAPSSVGKPMPPAGEALIPTRELIVGFVGTVETIYLRWTFPESLKERLLPDIEETLKRVRLSSSFGSGANTATSY